MKILFGLKYLKILDQETCYNNLFNKKNINDDSLNNIDKSIGLNLFSELIRLNTDNLYFLPKIIIKWDFLFTQPTQTEMFY